MEAGSQPAAPQKVCPKCAVSSSTYANKCPSCGKSYKSHTLLKVFVGICLAFLLLLGGCSLVCGKAANDIDKSLKKEQNTSAITNAQARSVPLGTTLAVVRKQLGAPKDTQEDSSAGLGSSTCIYYNIKGGQLLDSWQFCFTGSGGSAKLESKNRM